MLMPLDRLSPFYPGLMGVDGSDVPRGIRSAAQGVVYFVDASHPDASDAHDGTDPEHPLATIQEGIDKNNATIDWAVVPPYKGQNWIVIAPGVYDENLTPAYYCKMIGRGVARGDDCAAHVSPTAGSAMAGTGIALHLINMRFSANTAVPVLDFETFNSCVVEDCMITDHNAGLATIGLDMTSAGGSAILRSRFNYNTNPLTIGIRSTGAFYDCKVIGCEIHAVTTGIDLSAAGLCANALIAHNYIARPVTGINDGVGDTLVVDNWITASTAAITHAAAGTMCIANHVINNVAGAVELAATD